jgi:hypothetical protein
MKQLARRARDNKFEEVARRARDNRFEEVYPAFY